MRSPIRALLVALVATLGLVLVAPSIAEAKPKPAHSTKAPTKKTTVKKKTAKSTHRAHPSHAAKPWKKDHAKAHPKPQRIRKSSAGKHHRGRG
jgi:hypothetical protein